MMVNDDDDNDDGDAEYNYNYNNGCIEIVYVLCLQNKH